MPAPPALYNENDPHAAAWLRELVAGGHIAPGEVDARSITELEPADVAGLGQRHFFAGIGGWSHALRLAGVQDDASIWTGSCPCQPFSDAGRKRGIADDRHLWPEWFRLIRECRPAIILGEQVASRAGRAWLDAVFADLEGLGYACGAADLPAAGVGAPHRRQRLFFVAYADGGGRHGGTGDVPSWREQPHLTGCRPMCGMADPGQDERRSELAGGPDCEDPTERGQGAFHHQPRCRNRSMADSGGPGLEVVSEQQARGQRSSAERSGAAVSSVADTPSLRWSEGFDIGETGTQRRSGFTDGGWSNCDWIRCSDGVARPVEPGTHPLVDGLPGRVGLLRGYGNAIVPQVAAAFIKAALSAGGQW